MSNNNLSYINTPTRYIDISGVQYAYRSIGNPTGVPLVCLQHFTGTLDNWDPVIIDSLAKERQVITIDNTGVGNSEGTTPDNVQDMANDAIKIITALGIDQCDLLGFSLGGFLAQWIATAKPFLVRKIILVGTAPQGAKALYRFPQLVDKAFQLAPMEIFLSIFATKSENSRAKITAALQRLMVRQQDRDTEATMEAIQAQVSALTRWGTDPVTIDISKITHPVLIVQGSDDEMMDSASSMDLFSTIPNALLTYYPDAAHGSLFQYPEIFADQANSFLNHFE